MTAAPGDSANRADPARAGRWLSAGLLAAVAVGTAAWLWHPIVENYFIDDDFGNLFLICNVPLPEYLLTPQAGHVDVVRNGVFWVFARAFGTNARPYFTTVWITHLVNVALAFVTIRRFTASAAIACVGAILFGTCPAAQGSLGWYAVYGHVLATTCLLLILADASRHAGGGPYPSAARRRTWGVLALVGLMSFGVGFGIALALPFALQLILPQAGRRHRLPPLWPLLIVAPLLYVGVHVAYGLIATPEAAAQVRSVGGGIITTVGAAPRVSLELIAYAIGQLLAGPFPVPPFPALAGTALAIGAGIAVAGVLLRAHLGARRVLFAALLLTVACYGTIAAGRAVLRDVFGVATLVSQLRFHYLGLFTLALAVAAVLQALSRSPRWSPRQRCAVFATWLIIWLGALAWHRPVIDHHATARQQALFLVSWIMGLARNTPPDRDLYIQNRVFHGATPYMFTMREFPGWA